MGYNPELIKYGDGYLGLKEKSPFDKILITAGSKEILKFLLLLLKIGGEMTVPDGKAIQKMTHILRKSENKFEKKLSLILILFHC